MFERFTPAAGRVALDQVVGRLVPDADALRILGIDLDEVRRRAEASFGPGALDHPPRRTGRRRPPWRRARCEPQEVTGHLRFMPRAKRALQRALRDALALGDAQVGVEHILLGLLDPKGNMAIDLLRHLGVESEVVRVHVLADLGKAAYLSPGPHGMSTRQRRNPTGVHGPYGVAAPHLANHFSTGAFESHRRADGDLARRLVALP